MITRSNEAGTKFIRSIGDWIVYYKQDGRADYIDGMKVYYKQDGRIDSIDDWHVYYKQDGRIDALDSHTVRYNSDGDMQWVGDRYVNYQTVFPAVEKREKNCKPSASHATVFRPVPTAPYTRPILDQLSDLDWQQACNIL